MHTLQVVVAGLLFVGALLGFERASVARPRIRRLFLTLWAIACTLNGFLGVRAGYSVILEAGFFALTFGLPGAIAWRTLR